MSSSSMDICCWLPSSGPRADPMQFRVTRSGACRFSAIHPVVADLLRMAAEDPLEQCPEGSARLLPPPGEDEELRRDWQDHVQPELRARFDAARSVVSGDLEVMSQGRGADPVWSLEIPAQHTDAWLSTLNALRLALVAEHSLGEAELDGADTEPDLSSGRGLALFRVHLYAFFQECLLRALEEGESSVEETGGPK